MALLLIAIRSKNRVAKLDKKKSTKLLYLSKKILDMVAVFKVFI